MNRARGVATSNVRECEVGVRLRQCHAWFTAHHHLGPVPGVASPVLDRRAAGLVSAKGGDRDEHGRCSPIGDADETFGRNANDRAQHVVDLDRLAPHVTTAEFRFPEVETQHRHLRATRRRILGGDEIPAERGTRIKELEIAGADRGDRPFARRLRRFRRPH